MENNMQKLARSVSLGICIVLGVGGAVAAPPPAGGLHIFMCIARIQKPERMGPQLQS